MRAISAYSIASPAAPRIESGALALVRRLVDVALIALIGLVAITVALSRLAPLAGVETFVIRGGSMEPAIPLGSIVVAGAVERAPDVGEVVIYTLPNGAVVTHRVVGFEPVDGAAHLRTRGDANAQADPMLVDPVAVLGRVELVVPWLGYLAWLIGTPGGVIGLMSAVASLVMALWLLQELEWSRTQRMRLLQGRL